MSYPTVDHTYLVSLFPELTAMPSTVVTALNAPAQMYVGQVVWGDNTQYGLALAIAHIWTMGQRRGAGPVTSDSVGDLSTAFAAMPMDKSTLKMTTYGTMLWQLGRMLAPGGIFVGGVNSPPLPAPFGGYQPTWPERPNSY